MRIFIFLFPALLGLAACGGQEPAPAPSSPSEGMRAVVDAAAETRAPMNADLQPGESVQGVIQANVGRGLQPFRSLATKVAEDIGEQLDAKLGTGEGRKAIDDANRKLDEVGVGTQINAGDVRDFVGSMAGKTFHDSEVRHVAIISALQVSLSGKSPDGGALDIALSFDEGGLQLNRASLSYRPDMKSMFDLYETANDSAPVVTIEQFEKNTDGTYRIAGSFRAVNLPASKLAKKLKGQVLPIAEGRFDFAALPLKEMPKFGQ